MGVKQLWMLLAPVGRPVPLETLEGKILAIDSSIWLYQFQATMRDKEGRALVNAHILGFLRRISKLLFYGIKPVFVFDGGAPVLKRNTIAERKKRKSGAAASHAKVAEKLLAAQLRREALRHAEGQGRGESDGASPSKSKRTFNSADDDANYLEELSGPSIVLPGKHNAPAPPPKPVHKSTSPTKAKPSAKPASKVFREHDPYRLPELTTSIDARALPNDPRLATDEELRAYISHLRPDDPEFHELPAEAQYEILGELRLKSRTTSHRRLQKMLRQSKTPMDFSMAQIKNLGQRNRLTQEVLSTLNIVGTGAGGVVVPVKIASEKNREYVLVRNEEGERGFTLGIRQEGNTAEKPIVVEEEDEEGDDSFDSKAGDVWEDVVVPGRSQIGIAPDQDWRDFKRENALAGLAKRDTDKLLAPLTTKSKPLKRLRPAAVSRSNKGKGKQANPYPGLDGDSHSSEEEDTELQLAVQASLSGDQAQEDEEDDLQRALALSLVDQGHSRGEGSTSTNPNDLKMAAPSPSDFSFGPDSGLFGAPNGLLGGISSDSSSPPQTVDDAEGVEDDDLEMEEVVVNAPPIVDEQRQRNLEWADVDKPEAPDAPLPSSNLVFSSSPPKDPAREPSAGSRPDLSITQPISHRSSATRRELAQALSSEGEDDEDAISLPSRLMTILAPYQTASGTGVGGSPAKKADGSSPNKSATPSIPDVGVGIEGPTKESADNGATNVKQVAWSNALSTKTTRFRSTAPISAPQEHTTSDPTSKSATTRAATVTLDSSDEDMDEAEPKDVTEKLRSIPSTLQTGDGTIAKAPSLPTWFNNAPTVGVSTPIERDVLAELSQGEETSVRANAEINDNQLPETIIREEIDAVPIGDESQELAPLVLSDDDEEDMKIPWSRSPTPSGARSPVAVPVHTEPDFDSARSRSSRLQAEDEEHASFMSKVQGKSYAAMRESLDAEISALRKERAAALRDAEDVTAQMSAQIQVLLRLFGVPFVNAPMEAEAQCAFLAQRGLVEGVITDDSDVFLFGAGRVFRNMFNQSKTVECFLAADLERELGLDRETLIGLAYLLGSDYTEGLPGVGPVVAMEIMKEFPGESGLGEFRAWWRKVQVGKDTDADLKTAFRKRFKKKFTSLHLTEEWPNPKVREAYLNPAVDQSEERFQWGLPDLDGLRRFLADELSWSVDKIDETILPIIRRMTQRSNTSAANRQGTLTSFFDEPSASSFNVSHAPRKRQPYASKRLQQVVAEYRARKAGEGPTNEDDNNDEAPEDEENKTKRKRAPKAKSLPKGKGSQQVDSPAVEPESQDSVAEKTKGSKRKRNPGNSTRARRGGRATRPARGRGNGRVRAGVTSRNEAEQEFVSDDWSEGSKTGLEPEAHIPKKPRLRPRMKNPSPAPQSPADSENNSESSDEYAES